MNQTGTATSSPIELTASQSELNIPNTMIWMQRNAYEDSTIRKVADLLRRLQKNCNIDDPEEVKLHIARKKCSNGYKENLIEAYAIHMRSINRAWNQPFYRRYDKKRRAPKEELINFIIEHAKFPMNFKLSMSKDLGRSIDLDCVIHAKLSLLPNNTFVSKFSAR